MSITIHPTAIVSSKAEIGDNVVIGPYCIIEDDVIIGENTSLAYHCVLANGARIGKDCRLFSGAVVGTEPQDLKYAGERTLAIIGDRTTLREYASVNRATKETTKTIVGSDCLIMSYAHVAHDCVVGNGVILANVVQLAGHVHVADFATLGGVSKVHQFCQIGAYTMIGGDVKVTKDIPPYTLVGENPPKIDGINKIGLRRRGFSNDSIKKIEEFYNCILHSGLNVSDGIAKYLDETKIVIPEVKLCIDFIHNSKRGIYR